MLKAHPVVYDVLVVGVPDDRWGQAVCAVVQARADTPPPDLATLAKHTRTQLAPYKTPRHLVLVEEITRSPSGKPDYPWATRIAVEATAGDARV